MSSRAKTLLTGAVSSVVLAFLVPLTALADDCVHLLVPLPDGTQCVSPGGGPFGVIQAYFLAIYPWAVGTAAGIAILWTIITGAALILYAGDDSKRTEAKGWFTNALVGLFLIIFTAMIMHFINPLFFQ